VTWAIFGVAEIGLAVCLYVAYQKRVPDYVLWIINFIAAVFTFIVAIK
jgi:hypothetical protein